MEANTRPKQNEPVLFDSTHTARSEFTASRFTRAAAPAPALDIHTSTHTPQADSDQHTRYKQEEKVHGKNTIPI
jgi:hypothetical protein